MKNKFTTALPCLILIFLGSVSPPVIGNFYTKPLPRTVALTFDDGPNPRDTPQILRILKQHNLHATFFIVTRLAKRYPNLVRRIVAEGHVVANHTITHPRLTRLSHSRLVHEIRDSKKTLKRILGVNPKCLRPPFLATNRHVHNAINASGMYQIMGEGTKDYLRMGANRLTCYVLRHVHPGSLLIFHDGPAKRRQTVRALPKIIAGIKAKGLGFSTICK